MFTVANGQILDLNGKPWAGAGLNVNVEQCPEAQEWMLKLFPGTRFVRMPFHGYTSPSDGGLQAFVKWATAQQIVVKLEDHTGISKPPYTGAQLAAQLAWYKAIAAAFKDNPWVWFGSPNEPGPDDRSAVSNQHKQVYDAIRGTDNQTIIAMCLPGGGNPGTIGVAGGMTASLYATMKAVVWDLHQYGWLSGKSTNQATVNAALAGEASKGTGIAAAQSIRSADGIMPVIIGEYGDSTDGATKDANGDQVITAVSNSGLVSAAWAWRPGGKADILTVAGSAQNGPTLTDPFGKRIAAVIAAAANRVTTGPAAPPTHIMASPDYTTLTTKDAPTQITTTTGQHYQLIAANGGQIAVNGAPDTRTKNVAKVVFYNGLVYQTNTDGGWWSQASSAEGWQPTTAPPAAPAVVTTQSLTGEVDLVAGKIQSIVTDLAALRVLAATLIKS